MNLIDCLSEVKDPRRPQGQRYGKVPLLLIIIMAMLRHKYGYREIGRFCQLNRKVLLARFGFRNGRVPSHVSIRSFIRETDFASVQSCFHKWARSRVPIGAGEWLSIDGKSIRSTVTDPSGEFQNFVSLVSLFSRRREQVVRVERFENGKGSEVHTVEGMLRILGLKDVVLTTDALHCKKNAQHHLPEREPLRGQGQGQPAQAAGGGRADSLPL